MKYYLVQGETKKMYHNMTIITVEKEEKIVNQEQKI